MSVFIKVNHFDVLPHLYLILPYGGDVLLHSPEACSGPNAHPRFNRNII